MAVCTSCGVASSAGAGECLNCGRPLPSSPPSPEPSEALITLDDELRGGFGEPEGGPGAEFESGAVRGIGGWREWWPAIRAVLPAAAVLPLVSLVLQLGVPRLLSLQDLDLSFGARFTAALSLATAAFGAPWRYVIATGAGPGLNSSHDVLRVWPMSLTLAWAVALWFGLRAARRAHIARTGRPVDRAELALEVGRTALVAAGATALIGLLARSDWTGRQLPSPGSVYGGIVAPFVFHFTAAAQWLPAALGSALLAALLALAAHGGALLRSAAERTRWLRDWWLAARACGQALTVTLALTSAAGFAVVAVQGGTTAALVSLAVLPNLGLLLLGFGSGAGIGLARHSDVFPVPAPEPPQASLFDLRSLGAEWRMTALAAVAAAVVLAWAARRNRLDRAGRLRLALSYAVLLSALMLLAGAAFSEHLPNQMGGTVLAGRGFTVGLSFGLGVGGVLLANLLWAAVGALLLPAIPVADRAPVPLGPVPSGPAQPQQATVPQQPSAPPQPVLPPSTEVLGWDDGRG